jgi:ATP-dependent Lon protease
VLKLIGVGDPCEADTLTNGAQPLSDHHHGLPIALEEKIRTWSTHDSRTARRERPRVAWNPIKPASVTQDNLAGVTAVVAGKMMGVFETVMLQHRKLPLIQVTDMVFVRKAILTTHLRIEEHIRSQMAFQPDRALPPSDYDDMPMEARVELMQDGLETMLRRGVGTRMVPAPCQQSTPGAVASQEHGPEPDQAHVDVADSQIRAAIARFDFSGLKPWHRLEPSQWLSGRKQSLAELRELSVKAIQNIVLHQGDKLVAGLTSRDVLQLSAVELALVSARLHRQTELRDEKLLLLYVSALMGDERSLHALASLPGWGLSDAENHYPTVLDFPAVRAGIRILLGLAQKSRINPDAHGIQPPLYVRQLAYLTIHSVRWAHLTEAASPEAMDIGKDEPSAPHLWLTNHKPSLIEIQEIVRIAAQSLTNKSGPGCAFHLSPLTRVNCTLMSVRAARIEGGAPESLAFLFAAAVMLDIRALREFINLVKDDPARFHWATVVHGFSLDNLMAGLEALSSLSFAERPFPGLWNIELFETIRPRWEDIGATFADLGLPWVAETRKLAQPPQKLTQEDVRAGEAVERDKHLFDTDASVVVLPSVGDSESKEGKDAARRYAGLMKPISLRRAKVAADECLDVLSREFPWLGEANAAIAAEVALCRSGDGVFFSKPLLLDGPPGIGKTRWSRRVGEIVGVGWAWQSMAGVQSSMSVIGSERGYLAARPSFAADALLESESANPIILLDEIDKTVSGQNGDPLLALLPLLETETSSRFKDHFFMAQMDLSHVSWLMTANDAKLLPGPFLTRAKLIACRPPELAHIPSIAADLALGLAKRRGIMPEMLPDLDIEALQAAFARTSDLRSLAVDVETMIIRSLWPGAPARLGKPAAEKTNLIGFNR